MHEIERKVLLELPTVFGIDLSITNEVLLLWLAGAVTFVLLATACRRRGAVARGWYQNLFESLVEFIEKEVVRGTIGREGRAWAPFLLCLFFFILFANLLGMVPLPNVFKSATSSLSVTAGLALMVFVLTIGVNIRYHGVLGFLGKFVPRGVPRVVAVLVVPIEVVSWLAKPASLAVRLFANMLAGHALLLVFIALEVTAAWFLLPLPMAGAVIMGCFEIFVCFIQAFVFTMLTAIYISEAVASAH
jgi:F-type H+-transporting ATPase subunit a